MKQLTCEMCGSTNLMKQDGVYVCQSCGTKYTVEEAKKMMVEGTVDIQGTVKVDSSQKLENLYQLARRAKGEDNAEQASNYYGQILIEDPDSWEAQFYKTLFDSKQTTIAGIPNAAITVGNSIQNVFRLIEKKEDESKRNTAYITVYEDAMKFSLLLSSNALSGAQGFSDPMKSLEVARTYTTGITELNIKLGNACKSVGLNEQAITAYKASVAYFGVLGPSVRDGVIEKIKELDPTYTYEKPKGGCYVATAVYGSYDCPQVWTLRRYRDETLAETWYGRAFIHTYYAISPTLVKCFGDTEWFKKMWKGKLDRMVTKLQKDGVESTPYNDRQW